MSDLAVGIGWVIRHGSCIDPASGIASLEDLSVDVCITDPPYEAEAHEKGRRQNPTKDRRKRVVDDGIEFAAITEADRFVAAREIQRVTIKAAAVFCQVEAVHLWRSAFAAAAGRDGLEYRRAIPWVKPDAMPSLHGRWPGQSVEMLALFVRSGCSLPIGGKSRYYECTRERGQMRAHPTAKPLELMRQIVEDFTDHNDLVLDPFAGSASTGVACRMLGRRFIGWELSGEFFDISARRMNGDEAKPNPQQLSLLAGVA